jgi:anti-anti-sigma regulatory factor
MNTELIQKSECLGQEMVIVRLQGQIKSTAENMRLGQVKDLKNSLKNIREQYFEKLLFFINNILCFCFL